MRLAFIRTFGGTFGGDPGRIFRKAFRGTRAQRWPVGGKFIFTFKGTFFSTFMERFVFALNGIGHTRSSIFSFGVRTTAKALSGRNCRSNRSSVVSKLEHVSRVAT